MVISLLDRLKNAIKLDYPYKRLEEIAYKLKSEGFSKEYIKNKFEELLEYLYDYGNENQQDIVLDVLDWIVGWGINGLFDA